MRVVQPRRAEGEIREVQDSSVVGVRDPGVEVEMAIRAKVGRWSCGTFALMRFQANFNR